MTRSFLRHTATVQVPDRIWPDFEGLVRSPPVTSVLPRLHPWLAPHPGWQMKPQSLWMTGLVHNRCRKAGWAEMGAVSQGKAERADPQTSASSPAVGKGSERRTLTLLRPGGVLEEVSICRHRVLPPLPPARSSRPHLPLGTYLPVGSHCLQASRHSLLQALCASGVGRWHRAGFSAPGRRWNRWKNVPKRRCRFSVSRHYVYTSQWGHCSAYLTGLLSWKVPP